MYLSVLSKFMIYGVYIYRWKQCRKMGSCNDFPIWVTPAKNILCGVSVFPIAQNSETTRSPNRPTSVASFHVLLLLWCSMRKQASGQENKNPNYKQVCDKSKCLCACCIPSGLQGKVRVACTCVCNKCKCARSRGRVKTATTSETKLQPVAFLIVQEDPSKLPSMLPKWATSKSKSCSNLVSNNPAIAAVQQKESMMNCFEYDAGDSSPTYTSEESMEDKIRTIYYHQLARTCHTSHAHYQA